MAVRRAIALASAATGVPLTHRARPQLDGELARAQRYQWPLTVAVVCLETDVLLERTDLLLTLGENGTARHSQLSIFLAGAVLRDAIRGSDFVTYDARRDQYIILFTESTKVQAWKAAQRVQTLVYTRTCLCVRIGLAEFPADGLTLEDLITMACSEAAKEVRETLVYAHAPRYRLRGPMASQRLKCLMDVGIYLVALPFVLLLLALCCVAIRLDSSGAHGKGWTALSGFQTQG
jgi:hypothetical protein